MPGLKILLMYACMHAWVYKFSHLLLDRWFLVQALKSRLKLHERPKAVVFAIHVLYNGDAVFLGKITGIGTDGIEPVAELERRKALGRLELPIPFWHCFSSLVYQDF